MTENIARAGADAPYSETGLASLARILHVMDDPMFAYDTTGEIIYANAAYDNVFADRFPEGTEGHLVVDLEPEKRELLEEMLATNFARKPDDPDLVIESPSFDADGRPRWFEWRNIQEFDEDDNVVLVVAFSRDLTQQRLAELRAERAAERLEESNRDLLEFAQVASHDLQEPLRKVTAFANRLDRKLGDDLDEQARDYMNRMNNAVGRMQGLIDDLLTFARVNTRGTSMVPLALNDVVALTVSDLEIAISESGATVEVDQLPTLPVDASQMGQLFQNLIGNALKFQEEGTRPHVHVHAEHVAPAGFGGDGPRDGWYDIFITDNGIGFDEQYVKKIFAPFQRLHARTEYEGTGVGLSVCRRIAERHQGEISARSGAGEGATFIIRLPTSHMDDLTSAAELSSDHEAFSADLSVIDTVAVAEAEAEAESTPNDVQEAA